MAQGSVHDEIAKIDLDNRGRSTCIQVNVFFFFFLENIYVHVSCKYSLEWGDSTNPFMLSGLFYLNSLDRFIPYIGGVWLVFIITMFCKNFWT